MVLFGWFVVGCFLWFWFSDGKSIGFFIKKVGCKKLVILFLVLWILYDKWWGIYDVVVDDVMIVFFSEEFDCEVVDVMNSVCVVFFIISGV